MSGADLGGGGAGGLPPPWPPFWGPNFPTATTLLRNVGKISAGPPLTQILDPHLDVKVL